MNIKRRYDTFTEFVDAASEIGSDLPASKRASRTGSESFTATPDFESAMNLARIGWNEHANEIYELTEVVRQEIQEQVKEAFSLNLDVSGSVPDVARYLSGEPECMIDFVPQTNPVNDRAVNVLVSVSISGGVSTSALIQRGSAIAALIEAIEVSGISANLWIEMHTSKGGSHYSCLVNVKRAGEAIDASHIAFAIAHPSTLRRLFFAAMENEPKNIRNAFGFHDGGGYGRPCGLSRGEEINANLEIDTMYLKDNPVQWILDHLGKMGLLKDND